MEGKKAKGLTREEKSKALKYLMFLKEKRCRKIKGRGCADGRPQRLYKTKEETSSPTVSTEALFLTSMIDAMERRCVITMDIAGAFMKADMPGCPDTTATLDCCCRNPSNMSWAHWRTNRVNVGSSPEGKTLSPASFHKAMGEPSTGVDSSRWISELPNA